METKVNGKFNKSMTIKFFSSKDSEESRTMYATSDNRSYDG